jgi:hypothetical protein
MTFDEDELLSRALGDVGGRVRPGGRQGAEKGARRLRKDVFEVELVVSMPVSAENLIHATRPGDIRESCR